MTDDVSAEVLRRALLFRKARSFDFLNTPSAKQDASARGGKPQASAAGLERELPLVAPDRKER
jgi:hypothetical protein